MGTTLVRNSIDLVLLNVIEHEGPDADSADVINNLSDDITNIAPKQMRDAMRRLVKNKWIVRSRVFNRYQCTITHKGSVMLSTARILLAG